MAKKDGGNTISATGGVKIPPVDSFIAGYRAGAAKCVPGTKVLVGYSQDFIAQDKCKAVAQNQIAAGSKVVFAVAGPCGLGALAGGEGAECLGRRRRRRPVVPRPAHPDERGQARRSRRLPAVKAAQAGTLVGGDDFVFNLKNGGVALGKISPKVPAAYKAKLNALQTQIIAGKIKPPAAL